MSTTDSKLQRKKRFTRAGSAHGFHITDRDLGTIRDVGRFRMLDAEQLCKLQPGSEAHMKRRLRLLYDGGYLDRPAAQITSIVGARSQPTVYALGARGAQILSEHDGLPLAHLHWQLKNARAGSLFVAHTVNTAGIVISFLGAAAAAGWSLIDHFDLLPTFPERTDARGKRNPFALSVQHDGEDHALIPDRLFSLQRDGNRLNFALEYDAGTMPLHRPKSQGTSLAAKLTHYYAAWRSGAHTTAWNMRQFRVLIVTPSEERIANLQALIVRHSLVANANTSLFLLTTPQRLAEHGAFGAIWHTLSGRVQISLLQSKPQPIER